MQLPPLLKYSEVPEYKAHYEKHYQRGVVHTFDGIRVYFQAQKFGHAFYESSPGNPGKKDVFSDVRAQRMDWIKATLENPNARLFKGWNKKNKCYEDDRRVSVVYGDFIVVIELRLKSTGELKANFITCYVADKSIKAIESSPIWSKQDCLNKL